MIVLLDQSLAVIQHQSRHAAQWIKGCDLVGIAEARPWLVLESEAVEPQRDRDAADKGEIILSDENHEFSQVAMPGLTQPSIF